MPAGTDILSQLKHISKQITPENEPWAVRKISDSFFYAQKWITVIFLAAPKIIHLFVNWAAERKMRTYYPQGIEILELKMKRERSLMVIFLVVQKNLLKIRRKRPKSGSLSIGGPKIS